jgi:hypothetical protein
MLAEFTCQAQRKLSKNALARYRKIKGQPDREGSPEGVVDLCLCKSESQHCGGREREPRRKDGRSPSSLYGAE